MIIIIITEDASYKQTKIAYEALKEELSETKETLEKFKDAFEDRKKKWIQVKEQIDKNHEEEKIAVVKKMKTQLLKLMFDIL